MKELTNQENELNLNLIAGEYARIAVNPLKNVFEENEKEKAYLDKNSAEGSAFKFFESVKNGEYIFYPTGYMPLDSALGGGLLGGRLSVLGAGPGMGKTAFCVQMAAQMAQTGQPVIYMSIEVDKEELAARCISRETAENFDKVKGATKENCKTVAQLYNREQIANYTKSDLEVVNLAIERTDKYLRKIILNFGNFDVSLQKIETMVKEFISETGKIPVLIVDYLQLMTAPIGQKGDTKDIVTANIKGLAGIAKTIKVPVLALSSLSRENYMEEMKMSAMKESGTIEADADVVMGIQLSLLRDNKSGAKVTQEDYSNAMQQDKRKVELVLLKNRQGPGNTKIKMSFEAKYNLFEC